MKQLEYIQSLIYLVRGVNYRYLAEMPLAATYIDLRKQIEEIRKELNDIVIVQNDINESTWEHLDAGIQKRALDLPESLTHAMTDHGFFHNCALDLHSYSNNRRFEMPTGNVSPH